MTDRHQSAADASTADLVRQASEQISILVRDELALAKVELTEKAKHAGTGIGLFGAAGVIALYGVGALLVTVGLALALVMPGWLAALIVTVVLFATAGILALVGRGQVREMGSPVPEETVTSVKADVHAVTAAAKEGHHR